MKLIEIYYGMDSRVFAVTFICVEIALILFASSICAGFITPCSPALTLLSGELFETGFGMLFVSVLVATLGDIIMKYDFPKKK